MIYFIIIKIIIIIVVTTIMITTFFIILCVPRSLILIIRNQRERTRVKTVNGGYESLRQHVPTAARSKKMSKVKLNHYPHAKN